MKGEDTPPPHTPPTSVNPVSASSSSARPTAANVVSPLPPTQAKSDGSDKRQSEDFRHREVGDMPTWEGGEVSIGVDMGGGVSIGV